MSLIQGIQEGSLLEDDTPHPQIHHDGLVLNSDVYPLNFWSAPTK